MANKDSSAKKIDLSAVKKINFAKLKRLKAVNIIAKAAIYFLLICIGFVFLQPIFEMISKAIMTSKDLIDPSVTWIAKHATLSNFKNAIKTLEMPGSLFNSIWFSALLALAQTAVSLTTGFALSRYSFKGRNLWYIMLILAFILPIPLLTIPRIMVFTEIESIVGLLFSIFIGNVIVVGKSRYFIKNHDVNPELGEIFSGFKGNYLNVVKIMFLMNLKILLWLFLFIVPGFIKAYEYSMIPYLLAENPNLSADEAFSLSKQMTTGQKMDLFVLDLSFLGWIILGTICCGIGLLFVQPYPEATKAEVYLILKHRI